MGVLHDLLFAKRIFAQKTGYRGPFHFINHHATHAASVYFTSGFERSALITIDGTGERKSCTIGKAEGNTFTRYKTTLWPHSLGHVYAAATQHLGFKILEDEYKVMGLSAYGKPEYLDEFRKIIKSKLGSFEIDLRYTDYHYFKERWYSNKWVERFGPARLPHEPINQHHKNIASSLQVRLQEVLFDLASYATKQSGPLPLCIAGGVALNSLAMGKLAEQHIAKEIFVNPVSSDAGCALGAAFYIHHVLLNNGSPERLKHAYWGIEYSYQEIEEALTQAKVSYELLDNPSKTAAHLISEGHIIGWFQGRAEFGPRALGNRSILADPRNAKIKDSINAKIKHRESFRPFAPAILEEFQAEYFDSHTPVPFMTEVHVIKKEVQSKVPAVVHVDGTARLQTVNRQTNPLFWDVIDEFYTITGIPLVLNTSFNASGEPIVNSPHDAIKTFLKTNLDYLIIGKYLIKR